MNFRSIMRGLSAAAACFFFLAAQGALHAAPPDDLVGVEIDTLFIEMTNGPGEFTVIDARMDETATAGVFFGLVGAIANSAVNGAQDAELADRWRATAAELDLSGIIYNSFLETLSADESVTLSDDKKQAGHRLEIALKDWGLIRRNRESGEMRAFINVNVVMKTNRGRTTWRSYPNRVGKFISADLDDFTDEVFRRELTTLARKIGQNIAYEIIYR